MKTYRQVRPNLIPFVDYHTNILLVFILILAFSTIIKKTSEDAISANVIYQLFMEWPGESYVDADLWVRDPAGHIVGFNNREGGEGSLISLDHDALGARNNKNSKGETPKFNEEIVSLRGTLEGEYIVNVHDYAHLNKDETVKVTCKLVKIKPFKEIIIKEKELTYSGQEETFFRFKLNDKGDVVETNNLPAKIATINQTNQPDEP